MDDARELRQQGIRAAKAGQTEEARALLQQSIRLEPDNEAAWLWLASVARDSRERLFCLQKLLEINPENETARKALEAATTPSSSPGARRMSAKLAAAPSPTDIASQMPGVPMPMPDRIADAQQDAEALVRDYLAPLPNQVKWVHKTHRRAGEGDLIVYRTYVAGGIVAVLIVLAIIGFVVLQTNDDVRAVVLGPSQTPTPSPTVTPTNTPGLTPTASPTPPLTLTPSATPPPNLLAASPPALPRATEIYPQILERAVYDSIFMLQQGKADQAIPTLEYERKLTFDTRFDPNPYYYKALGLVQLGQFAEALSTLDEAVGRVGERPDDTHIQPFIDSGYAQVYWAQAQRALANGDTAGAQDALAQMTNHAQAAIIGDRHLVPPYLLLAQVDMQNGQFDDALKILNQALALPELSSNTELLVAAAQVYYQQRDYDRALYQVFLALYIDPSVESAYQLKIQIALARQRPGDAVLAAQDYLFYYPGSATAFRLLGQAREAEGNDDLALAAYTQGLSGGSADADAQKMLASRARIYDRQRRYDLALADYSRLFQISGSPADRIARMQEAFAAGQYNQALADARALSTTPVGQGIVDLVHGSALIEQAQPGDTPTYQQAVQLLTQAVGSPDLVASDSLGAADEYLARAQLELNDGESALKSINAALGVAETGSRHYWRGRILEAQSDLTGAIGDYEWVLGWSDVFLYPFRVDAQNRLDRVRVNLAATPTVTPTPTATPTQKGR